MTQDKEHDMVAAAELTRKVLREQKIAFADESAAQNLMQQVAEGKTHSLPLMFFSQDPNVATAPTDVPLQPPLVLSVSHLF